MSRRFIVRAKLHDGAGSVTATGMDGEQVSVVGLIPVGFIVELRTGAGIPDGWLLCDGSAYDPGAYPELHELLRKGYNGVLPDLREVPSPRFATSYDPHMGDVPGYDPHLGQP
jgi:hypothetical protein